MFALVLRASGEVRCTAVRVECSGGNCGVVATSGVKALHPLWHLVALACIAESQGEGGVAC